MLWEHLREEEFEEAIKKSNGVCLIPIGCQEKHGQHSPVGTDTIIASNVVKDAAELEYAVVFPTFYFGEKSGCGHFKGTITLSHNLKYNMLKEFCDEIYRNGFTKILLCNAHGGNPGLLNQFTRNMLCESPDYQIMWTDILNAADGDNLETILSRGFDYLTDDDIKLLESYKERGTIEVGHACFFETCVTHHYAPESIRLDKIKQESSTIDRTMFPLKGKGINSPLFSISVSPNSYSCDNDFTTNERISKAVAQNTVMVLRDKIKFLKEETISDTFHKEWRQKQTWK